MAYGDTKDEARARVASLALRVIADRIDNDESLTKEACEMFVA